MSDAFYTFYQVAMIVSLAVSAGVLLLLVHLRHQPGAKMMMALAGGTFVWTLGYFLEAHSATLSRQLLFTDIGYIGMMAVPVAWYTFAAQYVGDYRLSDWRLVRWLGLIALAFVLLIWTNGAHHLMWHNAHLEASGAFTITVKTYGPFFWIALTWTYLLIASGIVILLHRLFAGPPLYRNQAIALVIACVLPLIGNFFYMVHLFDIPHKDLTPVSFALSGLVIVLGFWRFHLFQAVPFAREIVVRRLKDGIFIFSPEGRLLDANTAGLDIVGSGQGIIGASLTELKIVSPLFETLSSGEPRRIEISLNVAGGPHTFELDTTALRDNRNRLAGWLSILHDITERKDSERNLAEALDHERELRKSLEEEITRRLRFSQALAHEVKALVDTPGGRRAAQGRNGSDVTLRLDELLDFTRGEMGLLETAFRAIEPLPVIRETVAELGKTASISMDLPETLPAVEADEARFRQLVRCLLDNALTRTGPGDTIRLTAREEDGNLLVEVRDSGPALSAAEQESLFNPYERAVQEQPGGLGLGLALGKMLVELHGGKIWADSRPGEGCTFAFSVPAAAEA